MQSRINSYQGVMIYELARLIIQKWHRTNMLRYTREPLKQRNRVGDFLKKEYLYNAREH